MVATSQISSLGMGLFEKIYRSQTATSVVSKTWFWLVAILLIKFPVIAMPPVWDTAMGVFPPAIYLSQNGFDLVSLLQQDGWWGGGPNVHPLSPVVWVIALTMWIVRDPTWTFIILHSLTFLISAFGLAVMLRMLIAMGVPSLHSFLLTLCLLLMPLVLVQVGYMYTEIPVMVCSIFAVDLWRRGRINLAIAVTGLALFIKFSAVALAASMALILILGIRSSFVKLGIKILVLGVLVVLARKLPDLIGRQFETTGNWGTPELLLHQLMVRMEAIPDVFYLLMASAISALVFFAGKTRFGALVNTNNQDLIIQAQGIIVLTPVLFCLAMIAGSVTGQLVLPRYLVPVMPFVLISIVLCMKILKAPQRLQAAVMVMGCVFFSLNSFGRFYPPNFDSFSVVERSHAYLDFNQVKTQAIYEADQVPWHVPIFVTREIYYMMSDPLMGYIEKPKNNIYPSFKAPYRDYGLNELPSEFYLLKASVIHGGRKMDQWLKQVEENEDYQFSEQLYENNGFTARLYHVTSPKP